MTTTIQISPQLIAQFNHAAGLVRAGNLDSALVEWDRLLNPTDEDKQETRVVTGDFIGQAYMRKAWVLMDLDRHAEAREVFEDEFLQACLGQFDLENLYEYYFSYANTLGDLAEIEPMDVAFSKAINIAADHLGDTRRMRLCWNNLLYWAEKAQAWKYILREVENCLQYAGNVGDDALAELAGLNKAYALARLGRNSEARLIVNPLMERARVARTEWVIARCEEILRAMRN